MEIASAKVPKLISSIREMGRKNQMNLDSLSTKESTFFIFPEKKKKKNIC